MDETKCLKIFSKTKIIPATNDLLASYLNLELIFLGTSEFFPVSSELHPCQPAEVTCSRRFRDLAWGSGFSKVVVVVPDLRVFIPPCLPTAIFLPPCAKQWHLLPFSPKHWLPPTWIQIQPWHSIVEWFLVRISKSKPHLVSLSTWWTSSSLVDLLLLEPCS
jgi:hypothetical protein